MAGLTQSVTSKRHRVVGGVDVTVRAVRARVRVRPDETGRRGASTVQAGAHRGVAEVEDDGLAVRDIGAPGRSANRVSLPVEPDVARVAAGPREREVAA